MRTILFVALLTITYFFSNAQQTPASLGLENNIEQESVRFIENKGQVYDQFHQPRPDVLFSGKTGEMDFHIRETGISYQLYRFEESETSRSSMTKEHGKRRSATIYRADVNWIGAKTDFRVNKGKEKQAVDNFYLGSCPEGIIGVKSYEDITFQDLYDGIDVKWYERNDVLEYDFIIAPGADYRKIKWEIAGATNLIIDKGGKLNIETPLGTIVEGAPIAFQEGREIEVQWNLEGDEVSFIMGEYDLSKPLVIDPEVRVWGTYFANLFDEANSAAIHGNSIYLAGTTASSFTLSTIGAHQTMNNGIFDAYLALFNTNGVRFWTTYYGGFNEDGGFACTVDQSSDVFLSGVTYSDNAIASASGSFQNTRGGNSDAFLVKFNEVGMRYWSTYYGGTAYDYGNSCATDAFGNVYLVGKTNSAGNIATLGSFHPTNYGAEDAFVVKFDFLGNRQWGTYFGGDQNDFATSCAVDLTNNLYIAGITSSLSDIASGGHQNAHSPGFSGDAYLAKFNGSGSLIWSTYYGGSSNEDIGQCTVDNGNNVYLVGYTQSTSLISTPGTHQTSLVGSADAFLVKFNSTGTRQWGTYFGGNSYDFGRACAIDGGGNVYISGFTASTIGVATPNNHQTVFGGARDAFLAKLDNLGKLKRATYYGGSSGDEASSCMVDGFDNVYMSGITISSNGIATPGAFQTSAGGTFLAKFRQCYTEGMTSETACYTYLSPSGKHTWNESGIYTDTLVNKAGCDSILIINLTINKTKIDSVLPDTLCDSGAFTLTAWHDSGKVYWYPSLTGGVVLDSGNTYTTPVLSSTTTYYAESVYLGCTSLTRVPVEAKIFVTPMVSSVTPGNRCDFGSVNLTASASFGTLSWFANASGGSSLGTGSPFTTAGIGATTTFYVEAEDNGCVSSRTPVIATVDNTPSISATTGGEVCDSGMVNLSASSATGTLNWYSAASGGASLGSGSPFVTPKIYTTTTFYVDATFNSCISSRAPVVATVYDTPAFISSLADTICDSGMVVLNTSYSSGNIDWYSSASGGVNLGSGNSLLIPMLNTTTTYWSEAEENGCITSRNAVTALVNTSTYENVVHSECYEYMAPSGAIYTVSGTYNDTIENIVGCDSIITINLTVKEADTSVVQYGKILTANATSATYQWIDCITDSVISGATAGSFTAIANGSYAVVVTQGGCQDTSDCFEVTTVGIGSYSGTGNFSIFPNPTEDKVTVLFPEQQEKVTFNLFNSIGQSVWSDTYFGTGRVEIRIPGNAGMYILQIETGGEVFHKEVIRQ